MGMDYSLVQRIIDGLGKILDTKPGSPDEGTYVTEQQLADWIKGQTVVPAYYYNGVMYSDALHTTPITGQAGALYIDQDNNVLYRWDGAAWDAMSDNQLRQDILDGTVIAKKAQQDQYGNTIDLTYATKAELQTSDANLNDALSAHEKRIENLEEAHGSYHEVDVKSVYTIPSGKGSNWLIDGLRGVSRVENNLLNKANLHKVNGSVTIADGVVTFTGDGIVDENPAIPTISGHIYLFAYTSKNTMDGTTNIVNYLVTTAERTKNIPSSTNYQRNAFLFTGEGRDNTINFGVGSSTSGTLEVKEMCLTDLNIYFNTTDLSFLGATDSAKLATIQTNYPWLLTPSDYGTSGVNTVYEGVVSKARNLFNQETEQGIIYSTGSLSSSTETGRRSADYLPCRPNVTYYGYFGSTGNLFICWYDSDKNFISRVNIQNITVQAPSNAYWYKLSTDNTYGATYKGDICINISDSQNGTYTPYKPPDTLTFPSPISLKSAGAVAETCEPCVEVKVGDDWVYKRRDTQRVGSYTFTGNETWYFYPSPDNRFFFQGLSDVIKKIPVTELGNVLLEGFTPQTAGTQYSKHNEYSVSTDNNGKVYVYVASWVGKTTTEVASLMAGKTIHFELADPVVTLSDPILDNLIATEAGGTIESILTYDVDDSMTLGYINL